VAETGPTSAPHSLPAAAVVEALGSDPDVGLDDAEATRRLAEEGPNALAESERDSRLRRLIDQFKSVLIWLLIVAAAISGVMLGEWIEAGVILAIVVLNATLGYRQESKAEEALDALKALSAPQCRVVRHGAEREIPSRDLVPGDLVVLEAGDLVPADIRVIDTIDLRVDESPLTGESLTVAKSTEPVESGAGLADRTSMVHAGTTIVGGRGRGVVTATGTGTQVGGIAGLLADEEPATPLESELKRLGWRLSILAVAVGAVIFGLGLAQDRPLESMFLLAVALAVAAIPEGLPAIVALTLARGVRRMAERNAIVRRLPAVEALGAATVICTDKTGTLTRNEIRVQETDVAGLHLIELDEHSDDRRIGWYVRIASLCNDARSTEDGWLGDPTEVALLSSADALVDVGELRSRHLRLGEAAFDAARKRMSTVHDSVDGPFLAVKGAPEEIIERCAQFEDRDGPQPLGPERARSALDAAGEMASRGLRTLALAYRPLAEVPSDPADSEENLVLVAVVGMRDELRPEARAAVEEAESAGITVVMITGDHEVTAAAIGRELGWAESRDVMTGRELSEIGREDLAREVETHGTYARVDPADKVKIVRAWQSKGEIVAMTGDGVNDAPALRIADIGVAMGSGTDVARQASDIVLADDNFATIVSAVREGRTIFANLRKVVSFLVAANISEVMVVLFGFLLWGGLGEPLLATQLLWVNLVTDGLPALALGLDPADPDVMRRRFIRGSVLGGRRQIRLLVTGLILTVPVVGVFAYGVATDLPWDAVRTAGFTALVLTQLGYVYALKVGEAGWKAGLVGNRPLAWAVAGSIVLQVLVVVTPVGHLLFDTVNLSMGQWTAAFVAGIAGSLMVVSASPLMTRWEAE
jgi:P-type Ca2+ transporter type 2C